MICATDSCCCCSDFYCYSVFALMCVTDDVSTTSIVCLCLVCLMLNLWCIPCMFLKNVVLPNFSKGGDCSSFLD